MPEYYDEGKEKIINFAEKIPQLKFSKGLFGIILVLVIVLYLASGIYTVAPDEQGVVRRFGKVVRITEPGLNYHFPVPIETVNKPKVKQVKRLELGFISIHPGPPARYRFIPEESIMLTGDEQIVDCQIIVQYQIKDAKDYLFNVRDLETPRGALKDATEVALRHVVGQRPIDDVLIEEKLQIEIDVREVLQRIMDSYSSGLRIIEVKLQTVRPPEEVAAAFNDVVSAKEDKERYIKEADGYREDIIPKARGKAEQIIREAEAYKEERVKHAQGDANKFLSVLEEYQKAREVTRKRLYLEAMEEVLPRVKKFVIDANVGGGILQLLPLEKFTDLMEEGGQKVE